MNYSEVCQQYFAAAFAEYRKGHYDYCAYATPALVAAGDHAARLESSHLTLSQWKAFTAMRDKSFTTCDALMQLTPDMAAVYLRERYLPKILIIAGLDQNEAELAYFTYEFARRFFAAVRRLDPRIPSLDVTNAKILMYQRLTFFVYSGKDNWLALEHDLLARVKRFTCREFLAGQRLPYATPVWLRQTMLPTLAVEDLSQLVTASSDTCKFQQYHRYGRLTTLWRMRYSVPGTEVTLKCFAHARLLPTVRRAHGISPWVLWDDEPDYPALTVLSQRLARTLNEADDPAERYFAPLVGLLDAEPNEENHAYLSLLASVVLSFVWLAAFCPPTDRRSEDDFLPDEARYLSQFFGTADELRPAFLALQCLSPTSNLCQAWFPPGRRIAVKPLVTSEIILALTAVEQKFVQQDLGNADAEWRRRNTQTPYMSWSDFGKILGRNYLDCDFALGFHTSDSIGGDAFLCALVDLVAHGYVYPRHNFSGAVRLYHRGIFRGPGVAPMADYLKPMKRIWEICGRNGLSFEEYVRRFGMILQGQQLSDSLGEFADQLRQAHLTPADLGYPADLCRKSGQSYEDTIQELFRQ